MSKSPLSGAFAGSSEPAKKNKKNGALLLISGIALATSIGGVFAANSITINGGAAIEFGQGTAAVNSCEGVAGALDTSITQVWNNDDEVFEVGNVVVDGISADCSGVTFKVSLLAAAGTTIATYDIIGNGSATSDTEDLSGSNIDASTVARITVTTE
jgi:hypothetical protein